MATRLETLRAKRTDCEAEIVRLAKKDEETGLSAGEAERFERSSKQLDKITAEIVTLEERTQRVAEIQRKIDANEVRFIDGVNRGEPTPTAGTTARKARRCACSTPAVRTI